MMSLEELEKIVSELKDRAEIHECLMNYSRGVDRLDRELLMSVYHPDAVDDHGIFVGGPNEFADWVFDMHTRTHLSHQHCQFNSTVELVGDVAHAETYYMFVGLNRQGTPLAMSGGRYIDRLERRGGRWAIAERICVRDWAPLDKVPDRLDQSELTSVKGLPEAIKTLMRTGAQVSRDRHDPSYMRPLTVDRSRVTRAE
jgi:ketosteroid isomerase-like protein